MAITIPDRTKVYLTTGNTPPENGHLVPGVVEGTWTNPGPAAYSANGPAANGQALLTQAGDPDGRLGYAGYQISAGLAAGDPAACFRAVTVEGFAGCTPGGPVYIATAANGVDLTSTASGLTHTAPGTASAQSAIGVAVSATRIKFN